MDTRNFFAKEKNRPHLKELKMILKTLTHEKFN